MVKHLPPESDWHSLPSTRAEAKRADSRWYFTGAPCTHGHVAPKRTGNCTCVQCARDHSASYVEKHIRPGVEARKAQREAERPMREAARKAKLEAERPARLAALKEKRKQKMRDEGTEEVRAEENEHSRELYNRNPEAQRERQRQRRARGVIGWKSHRLRTPPWLTEDEREQVEEVYAARTEALPVVDHHVPIDPCGLRRVAGLHVPWQLSLTTQGKNTQRVGVTFTADEEEDLVRRGFAVWAEDVDARGNVDWSKYPRPTTPGGGPMDRRVETAEATE